MVFLVGLILLGTPIHVGLTDIAKQGYSFSDGSLMPNEGFSMLSFDVLEKKQPLTGGMIAQVDVLIALDASTGGYDVTYTLEDEIADPDPNATGETVQLISDAANPSGTTLALVTDPSTGNTTVAITLPADPQKPTPITPKNTPTTPVTVSRPQPFPISLIPIFGSIPIIEQAVFVAPTTPNP
jgi:hypothetical protein